jgi:subtilisin family serine protease
MKQIKITTSIVLMLFAAISLKAVDKEDSLKLANWQNLDPQEDKLWGIRTEKAYQELLQGKKSQPVIVAVIDGGVDINHEDLKDFIWVNKGEIPDNGIDDDHNGYIDDVHGWSFLGNAQGENIDKAPLEVTRLYRKYLMIAGDRSDDELKELPDFDYTGYQEVKDELKSKRAEYKMMKATYEGLKEVLVRYDSIIVVQTGKKNYTSKDLKKLKVEKKSSADSALKFIKAMNKAGLSISKINKGIKYFTNRIDYHFNPDFAPRKSIIGDNTALWSDTVYGNNNVSAAGPDHGTMVSSIIGANRKNNLGVKGVADNIIIMPVRTVPDGDEWDKDVAKSIEYAILNGAQIINMSFGKSFSPQKEFVDRIIKLADEHDVLLVHASGNDSKNVDRENNFPNKYSAVNNEVLVNNWITVGATSKDRKKKEFIASFSNYGKKSVDLFAPGHNLLMCTPGNKYEVASGTSFAAPMVTGAAALIKSYYPDLSAAEIKSILLESSNKKNSKVVVPGSAGKNKVIEPFSELSASGGFLDVYSAIQLAEKRSKAKK